MDEAHTHHVPGMLYKAALWLLSAAVTVFGMVVWDNHVDVSEHSSLFNSVWNADFRRRIEDDLDYPTVHETYRRVFVEEDARFKEDVRRFMAAGSRFSRSDWEKGEAKFETRIDALAKRIRALEDTAGQYKFCETRYRELELRLSWLEAITGERNNREGGHAQ